MTIRCLPRRPRHNRSLSEEARAIQAQHVSRHEQIRTGEERGDVRPESDWDILVLLDGLVDPDRKQALRHPLFEPELESGGAISTRIYTHAEWQSEPRHSSSFARNVRKHAIAL